MDGRIWYKVSFYMKAPDNLFENTSGPLDELSRLIECLTHPTVDTDIDDLVVIKESA